MGRRPDATTRHPAQLLALAIGVVYTLVGIAGFFVTGFDNFAAETNKTLLGFEVNPLHNIVHLAIGLAGLALWRRLDTARTYGWLLAAGYGLAFIYGLFAASNRDINFLSLNGADNILQGPVKVEVCTKCLSMPKAGLCPPTWINAAM
jgi:ABC-type transport system involved in multi-copper enzyme maturation permease subunit